MIENLTPIEIKVLLIVSLVFVEHKFYQDSIHNSPRTLKRLENLNLIYLNDSGLYMTTDLGKEYINRITSVKIPEVFYI